MKELSCGAVVPNCDAKFTAGYRASSATRRSTRTSPR